MTVLAVVAPVTFGVMPGAAQKAWAQFTPLDVPHYELLMPPSTVPLKQPRYKSDFESSKPKEYGTEQTPFFVEIVPAESPEEIKKRDEEKSEQDRKLANYTAALFYATLFLGAVTAGLVAVAYRQMSEARASIKAARDSADAAKQAFIAGHRAWLRVDVSIGSNGVTINENSARVDICYRIENIGNAPASNVTTHEWLVPFNGGMARPEDLWGEEGDFPIQIQRKRCNEIRRKPFDKMGFFLFPNEVWPDVTGIGGSQHGIHLNKTEMQRVIGESSAQGVGLFIVGCIDYTFPSDFTNHHQTWFSYSLAKEIKAYKTGDLFVITPSFFQVGDGNVPKDNLMLIPDPFGMGRHAD